MTKWTAPDIASIRGDNSRPLQKIFGSLSEHLKDYQNGYTLDGLDDVVITSPTAGQTLSYDAVNSLWKNATFSDGGGLTNLNASNLASGTVPTARISGSYTGITSLGTLTSLTIDGPSSPSVFFGDWNQNNNWSGIRGTHGYLLTGSSSVGDTGIYLRTESNTHPVHIGANNTNTLVVTSTSATLSGELLTTTSLGAGRGVGIRADPTNAQSILQFTNNAASVQWSSIVATNNLLNVTTPFSVTGTMTASARVWAQTDLRVGNANSAVLSSDAFALLVTPSAYTGLISRIGEHFGLASIGSSNNDFTVWSSATVRIKRDSNITIATFNSTGMTIDGVGSPSFTLGDTGFAGYSGLVGDKGYLLLGNSGGDPVMYLRTVGGGGPVYIGAAGSNTLHVGNGSASIFGGSGTTITATTQTLINGTNNNAGIYLGGGTASTATGGIEASWRDAANPSIAIGVTRDNNRTMTVHSYVDNTIRFYSGNTVKAYVNGSGFLATHYYGNVQYGNYGSMSVYGENGGWYGIVFPDQATTWMSAANGQYFGCYRNNSTWNFYVINGTFTPSDERYKRDIEPLQHGMNLIRGIVPVTYDPLTEDPSDDPEQTVGRTHYGFTTQNILQALTNAGETRDVAIVDIGGPANESNESDRQYLNHSGLIAPMVKAIQELDTRLQQLETV